MNILFVSSDNNSSSGAFLCMVELANILKKNYKHNVFIILPYHGTGESILIQYGLEFKVIKSYHWTVNLNVMNALDTKAKSVIKKGLNLLAINRIKNEIINRQIDILHINTSWSYVGAKAANSTKIPFVWHIREALQEGQKKSIWNSEKGYSLMKTAAAQIAISDFIYNKYSAILGKEKIYRIYDGMDVEKYYLRNRLLFQSDEIKCLILGEVRKWKGQLIAIKAVIDYHEKYHNPISLDIVGRGDEQYIRECKDYINEHNANEYVRFLGHSSKVVERYKCADIFLLCSNAEAFGRVTAEGMLAGLLVIASNSGASPELIGYGENGLLYTPGNYVELREKIKYAVDNKREMQIKAQKGQAYIYSNMTLDKNAREVDRLYQTICKKNSRRLNGK